MRRSRFWRMSAALVVGAIVVGIPLRRGDGDDVEEQAATPGVNLCVFYGICVGPSLPER